MVRFSIGIFPDPFSVNPVTAGEEGVAVQVKLTLPATLELKATAAEGLPEQIDWDAGAAITVGAGFTVMACVALLPGQVPADGVTVYVTTPGDVSVLLMVMTGMVAPVPEAMKLDIPAGGTAEAVHEKVALATLDVRVMAVVEVPAQMDCVVCEGVAVATGCTVTS